MLNISPLRRRWMILTIIFGAIVLNYIDRQIVSILKPTLKAEFALDDRGYAVLINVFTICYAAMYPVTGWLVDRFGAGRMMLAGVVTWSLACLGAGFTRSIGQLTFFRAMLGAAEPMVFPAHLRVVTTWFPASLRATANGVCVAGSSIGALIAPPVVAWLALNFNWHMAFIVPGAAGLVIGLAWWLIYRDPPAEIAKQAAGEGAPLVTPAFTWPQLWRRRSLWGILLCRFVSDPVWYFCLFWLPGYLQESSGLTLAQVGMVGWIPFLVADIGGVGTSIWSDRLVRGGMTPLRARKVMLTGMALLGPICVLTPHLPHT
ncbi:MAG TPA: MFS transporter, partial [Opitutus sp.]|nr:MFS transporter [Opitutus sp.]